MVLPATYPVTVSGQDLLLQGLVPLNFDTQNPLLPPLYKYPGPHPHHHMKSSNNKTYVYLVDLTQDGKDSFSAITKTQKVLGGRISGMLSLYRI